MLAYVVELGERMQKGEVVKAKSLGQDAKEHDLEIGTTTCVT
jgi:hypothetical protein